MPRTRGFWEVFIVDLIYKILGAVIFFVVIGGFLAGAGDAERAAYLLNNRGGTWYAALALCIALAFLRARTGQKQKQE